MGALLIGIGKRGKPSMPPPERETPKPTAKAALKPGDEPDDDDQDDDKLSPEKAIVIRAGDHCVSCKNYHPDTGECDEVEGTFEPDDACWAAFKPMGGGDEQEQDASPAAPPQANPDSGPPR